MPRNVEIKAKVADPEKLHSLAMALTNSCGEILLQEDTFFVVPSGRLKLRTLNGKVRFQFLD